MFVSLQEASDEAAPPLPKREEKQEQPKAMSRQNSVSHVVHASINSLPNDKFLDWIKSKAFADNN